MPSHDFEGHHFYVLGRLSDPAPGCEEIAATERQRAASEPDPRSIVAGDEYAALVNETRRLVVESDNLEQMPYDEYESMYPAVRSDATALGQALHALGGTELMKRTIELYVPDILGMRRSFDIFFNGIGGWKC